MPTIRAEFSIEPDLVFADSAALGNISDGPLFNIEIRNGAADQSGHVIELIASVVGPAPSLQDAADIHRAALAESLDALSFATHARFRIRRVIRTIDWDEGQVDRHMLVYAEQDAAYPPEPVLEDDLMRTARMIGLGDIEPFVRRALKHFRLGLVGESLEDQFVQFWHAIEIIGENTKNPEPVEISCRECQQPLVCHCGTAATRAPMAKQGIGAIVAKFTGTQAQEVSRRLFGARNALMHGGTVEGIEAKFGVEFAQIVNELGTLAWHATVSLLKLEDRARFNERGWRFATGRLAGAFEISFRYDGPGHPRPDQIPNAKVEIMSSFKPAG